jgi:hypothetical protein
MTLLPQLVISYMTNMTHQQTQIIEFWVAKMRSLKMSRACEAALVLSENWS